jgi:hypothetical protein
VLPDSGETVKSVVMIPTGASNIAPPRPICGSPGGTPSAFAIGATMTTRARTIATARNMLASFISTPPIEFVLQPLVQAGCQSPIQKISYNPFIFNAKT